MIKKGFSTLGPMGTLLAQALEAEGIDAEGLFQEAGFELASLRDPSVRMPGEAFQRLLNLVEQRVDDPAIGLSLARYIHPTSFYSMGIAGYCSATLREYLQRLVKYYRLITSNDVLIGECGDDPSEFVLRTEKANPLVFPPLREDGIAAILTGIVRIALHRSFTPVRVALARPSPDDEAPYTHHFGCEVTFNASHTEIVLPMQVMDEPLSSADPTLAEMYEAITVEYLDKMDKADFPARVQNELVRLLPVGVSSKEKIAEALNMSTRTLYNKLEAAGTTYREVLDDTRQRLAEQYIRQGLPVYEIAYLIGFSDTANFSRAFKKWTGSSPIEFRQSEESVAS